MKNFIFLLLIISIGFSSDLHKAVEDINEKKIHKLIQNGADINAVDINGRTALILAAPIGRLSIVIYLVKNGANLHVEDKFGKTALLYAIEKNQVKVVMYLSKKQMILSTQDTNETK